MSYLKNFKPHETPQSEPIPDSNQVQNSAGGYVYEIDSFRHLERFLILGSEGGTYYAGELELTRENANNLLRCIKEDGMRTVAMIVNMSISGRIPKNDVALFALALCSAEGDDATRKLALENLPQVARTGSHLLTFVAFVDEFRGWGRGLKDAVGNWYLRQEPRELAYQVSKYRQRSGWSQRDVLRLARPNPEDERYDAVFRWITQGIDWRYDELDAVYEADEVDYMRDFDLLQSLASEANSTIAQNKVIDLITTHRFTWEMVPDAFRSSPDVWLALLETMPMTAMIRNLPTMTRVGLIKPMSDAVRLITDRLRNEERLHKARVHPVWLLSALRTYSKGVGRNGRDWDSNAQVLDALNDAFYLSFDTVESTQAKHLLAVDVSGSMGWGEVVGTSGITPREGAAAMALAVAKNEPQHHIMGFSHQLQPLNISPNQRMDDVVRTMSELSFGGTDCALPMVYAEKNDIPVDVFVIITDSETWYGRIHPVQALRKYRQKMGIDAKLVVMAMTATEFSIADPDDAGMLDTVGFDTATPQILRDFIVN